MWTVHDLVERLKVLDEITLIEILDLTSEDILNRFEDVIIARFDEIAAQIDDDEIDEDEIQVSDR